jgi:Fic family protein
MATKLQYQKDITLLKADFDALSPGKETLLTLIDETELPEQVYNSNAIENSTLTLRDTERILMEMEMTKDLSVREVFEAKNLARVSEYIKGPGGQDALTLEKILLLHQMLIGNIRDDYAGRFRQAGEYVRVGMHIAPAPEKVEGLLAEALSSYYTSTSSYFVDRIATFHLTFEHTHPFCDGNGRIGRVLINYHLRALGFPPVIIRNKEKRAYYDSLRTFDITKDTGELENILVLSIKESLHKRLAYLRGDTIIKLSDYAKQHDKSIHTLLNAAKRQTLPAFREKGVWKIGRVEAE